MKKYFNQPTDDGFDSRKERRVFAELEATRRASDPRERASAIERQVKYELVPAQYDAKGRCVERAVTYVADFKVTYADGHVEVIDAKSSFTRKLPVYVVKRKLMLWRFGVPVREA